MQHVCGIFKKSDQVHACPEVAKLQQMEEWTNQPHGAVSTYTEERNLEDEYSMMISLIYPEDSNDKEDNHRKSPIDPPSVYPTLEPNHTSVKPNKELTS